MNHFAASDNMVESLAFSAHLCYDSLVPQPHIKAGLDGVGSATPNPKAQGGYSHMCSNSNHTTSPAGNASPTPSEDHQKIVTLPAMARHVSRAELMKLIHRLQSADRPASARVITCDFASSDDDGGEAA